MDVTALLALLRALPAPAAERITVSIEQLVPTLSEALYQAVCDGSMLLALDDGALQRLIPRLPHREWGLLLKYAALPVRERVFRNVTGRVARMLQEEIELARPGGLTSLVAVQHRLQAAILANGI
jgi:flagellar motor switch protein FliG